MIAVDFRGHGASPSSEGGHSVAQYARDVHALIEQLDLEDAVLVGWSMGSIVAWEYQRQFAEDPRLAGSRDRVPGPVRSDAHDWPNGMVAPLSSGPLEAPRTDIRGFFAEFVPAMFKTRRARRTGGDGRTRSAASTPTPARSSSPTRRCATCAPMMPALALPTCSSGAPTRAHKQASGAWLAENLPSSELHVFEDSGHCPMREEPERFNALVAGWVGALSR